MYPPSRPTESKPTNRVCTASAQAAALLIPTLPLFVAGRRHGRAAGAAAVSTAHGGGGLLPSVGHRKPRREGALTANAPSSAVLAAFPDGTGQACQALALGILLCKTESYCLCNALLLQQERLWPITTSAIAKYADRRTSVSAWRAHPFCFWTQLACEAARASAELRVRRCVNRAQLDNVLLATDAEGHVSVKICDFGYSNSEPACHTRCGTPEYMAPEASPTLDPSQSPSVMICCNLLAALCWTLLSVCEAGHDSGPDNVAQQPCWPRRCCSTRRRMTAARRTSGQLVSCCSPCCR